ncbi:MAG: hypothetical protein AAF416_07620 [Pseudomonadota bacterium]
MDVLVLLAIALASQEAGPVAEPSPPIGAARLVACLAERSAGCGCVAEEGQEGAAVQCLPPPVSEEDVSVLHGPAVDQYRIQN